MAPELVVVQGLRDTRGTLSRWNARPFATIGPWFAAAAGICATLLVAVLVVAHFSPVDSTGYLQPGVTQPPQLSDVGDILFRNSLVLTLHAMACIAGFIAGSSLPLEAERYSGVWRWVHDKAGPLAIPELIGLFLPLAAWTRASRRGAWSELLAATFVTVAFAIPLVVGAAFVEVYVSPHVIAALR
jgi:hypothetical protein